MNLTISSLLLQENLNDFFGEASESAFLVHCDVGAWGLLEGAKGKEELLLRYSQHLFEASSRRSVVFPLFNYDYAQKRLFDVLNDKCQVGVLNEHVRLSCPKKRTMTPMFNFIECMSESFSLSPKENPFSEESFFGEFHRSGGRVCFMGAGFPANTFIHYAEEVKSIGYRYLKPMPGIILKGEERLEVKFFFRARPRIDGVVDYDWPRLEKDLFREGLLDVKPLGMGKILSYNVKDVMDFWFSRLESDEFYLLTDASKSMIDELRKTKPYPFRYEDFEKDGSR